MRIPNWLKSKNAQRIIVSLAIMVVLYFATKVVAKQINAPKLTVESMIAMGPQPVAVSLIKATPAEIYRKITYTGTVAPYYQDNVFARVTGYLEQIQVDEGDFVKKGSLIARLDKAELNAKMEQAKAVVAQAQSDLLSSEAALAQAKESIADAEEEKAQAEAEVVQAEAGVIQTKLTLAKAKAGIAEAEASIAAAKAELSQAEADWEYWKEEYRRQKKLLEAKAISKAEYDRSEAQTRIAQEKVSQAKARLRQAEANLSAAKVNEELAQANIKVAEKHLERTQAGVRRVLVRLEQAKLSVKRAEAMLEASKAKIKQAEGNLAYNQTVIGYTEVRALSSGVCSKRHCDPGILLQPGSPIITIATFDKVRVQAKVSEADLPLIKRGTPAEVRFGVHSGKVFTTKVGTVFPEADPATRTITVELILDNHNYEIKLGEYAVVDFIVHHYKDNIVVPKEAVLDIAGQPTVFIQDGLKSKAVPVGTGISDGLRVAILSGLNEGDMVIYKGNRGMAGGEDISVAAVDMGEMGEMGAVSR